MAEFAAPTPPPPQPAGQRAPAGRVVLVVIGALLALAGLVVGVLGGVLLWAHATQRDDDGFFTTDAERLETVTHAITSEEIDLGTGPGRRDGAFDLGDLATVRLRVDPQTEAPVFVGIGPQQDVAQYLDGVAHAEVTDVRTDPFRVTYDVQEGGDPSGAPTAQPFWAAQVSGRGEQTLEWELESGEWAVVVMNAEGSAGVAVEASVGVKVDWLLPASVGMLVGALVLLALGVVLVIVGARGIQLAEAPGVSAAEPVRLEARLEEPLSPWLWLVKWLLLIPHFIALAVLWLVFAVLTVIAGFAILFTGRYPRPLFELNVGVLRWTWRVAFYSFGGFATDRYPPFTLGRAPDYPATLDIAYPERLSRWLVLVKWWLLAIPHYVVVGILVGGATGGWWDDVGGWTGGGSPGLITWLALVAAVVVLVTSRYPRGLFDLLVGLNRWVYRVIPYAALMTDRYPPFRLDQGGTEPASTEPAASLPDASLPGAP